MVHGARFRVNFRRRREGKTNYRYRLALLKSNKCRAVVRKTNQNTIVQFVEYGETGDKILATATSQELKSYGWTSSTSNLPAAYLTALLAGKKAKSKKIDEAVLDIGIQTIAKGSKIFAALKGILDSGISIQYSKEILPTEERIMGKHINEKLPALFDEVKTKIINSTKV